MAEYSTNRGGGGGDGDNCELCGRSTAKLRRANVAGADLLVCPDYASHGESRHTDRKSGSSDASRDDSSGSRKKRAAQRTAKLYDSAKGDSKHWEGRGTDYEKGRLPYFIFGYNGVVESAQQGARLQFAKLTDELDLDEKQLLATEQGHIARANAGGSAIRAPGERLDVALIDE